MLNNYTSEFYKLKYLMEKAKEAKDWSEVKHEIERSNGSLETFKGFKTLNGRIAYLATIVSNKNEVYSIFNLIEKNKKNMETVGFDPIKYLQMDSNNWKIIEIMKQHNKEWLSHEKETEEVEPTPDF